MRHPSLRMVFWVALLLVAVLCIVLIQGIVTPFAVSFVLAYFLDPLVDRLETWRIARGLAAMIVLIGFLLGLGLVIFLLVPLVEQQIVQLATRMPGLVKALQDQFGHGMQVLEEHLPEEQIAKLRDLVSGKIGDGVNWVAGLLQNMITSSLAILNIVSLVVITPIVTFFLLRDWDIMVAHIDSYLPRQPLNTIRAQASAVGDTLAGFIRGQALVCVVLALYYGSALWLAGLESALAVGMLIGVLAIIPVLGAAIGFLLSVGLATLQYGTWSEIFIVAGIFLFGQTVEANVLTPKLVGDRINLHPVWVIFALLAGGQLMGFLGVLISVPAAAVIGVLVRFALLRYRRSMYYDPHQPEPVRGLTPY